MPSQETLRSVEMTQAHRVKVRQKLAKFAYNPETENKLLKNCLTQNIPAPEEMRGGGVIENVKFDKKVPSISYHIIWSWGGWRVGTGPL